jgi:hypothetical protein
MFGVDKAETPILHRVFFCIGSQGIGEGDLQVHVGQLEWVQLEKGTMPSWIQ